MSTLYQSSKDVPTEVLAARLNELADVASRKRDRMDAEFTMRIPAEHDRDADLVMSEAAVRLEALQAENAQLLAAIRRMCNIYVVDDYYDDQLREECLDEAVNRAINAVKETQK